MTPGGCLPHAICGCSACPHTILHCAQCTLCKEVGTGEADTAALFLAYAQSIHLHLLS